MDAVSLATTYSGIRVLDLSTNIAGPFAAMALGDMGADVIKVERPTRGDDTRALPPFCGDEATVFLAVNRNKRSVVLDVKSAAGRQALLRLVERADVVVESFSPGLAAQLSLTFDDFKAHNPKIVVCSISAFGDGPLGVRMPGYDALVQAVSGMMSFTGHAATPPVRLAPSVLDLSTGLWALVGIMAALTRRAVGAGAEHVKAALLDSAFTLMCHQVLGYLATGNLPEKLGSGAPSATPYRVFAASDGAFMLATANDAQFERLCRVLGLDALASDERFRTMPARLQSREELDAHLAAIFAREPVAAWLERLSEAGLSVGNVNDLDQALAEPVTRERQLFVPPRQLDWIGGMPLLRLPIDVESRCVRRPPPKLGEHTTEVLREANFDAAAIERLRQS